MHEWCPHAHRADEREHTVERKRCATACPCLQGALGFHHEPRRPKHCITEEKADACCEWKRPQPVEARAGERAACHGKSTDVHSEHDALEERRDCRSAEESQIPPSPV